LDPIFQSGRPSHASGCPLVSRSFEQFKVASVWTSWQHIRTLWTKSCDTHSYNSSNEVHHMEHEVLFHTLFHPTVLSNQILSCAKCYASNLSLQIRKQKPPISTWHYYIRDKLLQRNIFFLLKTWELIA
jgi:hypothetical protein